MNAKLDNQRKPPEVFYKKGAFKSFPKFTGKQPYQNLFFNKIAGIRPSTLLKKRLWHRSFSVNFEKLLKITFSQNTSGRLLLGSPETAPKTYWSTINRFLNTKKIPVIPFILVNGKLISDFQKKVNLFNNHFASQ